MTDEAGVAPRPRWLAVLRALPLALGAVHIALFAYVVLERYVFPVELEWMSGAVWDHVERVMQGKPIYVAPSATFIPFMYPPLHYWLSALVAKAMPIPQAARTVSLLATCATGVFVVRATRKLTASWHWSLIALALFAGAFSVTGFWYDLDRSDTLMTALVAGGFVVALGSERSAESLIPLALGGALVGLGFIAKQPASVFLLFGTAAIALTRRWRQAAAFLGGGLVVLVPAVIALSVATDGWFWFYCIKMPGSHGVMKGLLTVFFVLDASKTFALFGACLTTAALLLPKMLREGTGIAKNDALFAGFACAGFFTSMTSRLHNGGYINGLVFMTTFGAIAFCVLGARATTKFRLPVVEALVTGIAIAQLVHFLYDPSDASPNRARMRDARIVADRVRTLERGGEVIVVGRSHITAQRHFHIMALMDILRTGQPIPEDLKAGLSSRTYAAYIIDEPGELGMDGILGHRSELFGILLQNYFFAQRLDDREPNAVIGWMAHPSWVLRPRKTPLVGFKDAQLERRARIETGICEMRMRAVQAGAARVDLGDEVETLAAAVDDEHR